MFIGSAFDLGEGYEVSLDETLGDVSLRICGPDDGKIELTEDDIKDYYDERQ
jgi:hypothetical protein